MYISVQFTFSQVDVFYHYGNKDGLSQESIQTILKSNDGFLWLGTQDGLNRFDGKQFTVYKHNDSENSISGNFITDLLETDNAIWIGTSNNGLSVYNPTLDVFNNVGVKNGNVTALAKDNKGTVYVGYLKEGLKAFRNDGKNIGKIEIPFFKDNNFKITSLQVNDKNELYVGTKTGRLFKASVTNDNYNFTEVEFCRTIGSIKVILFDKDKIWLGTSDGVFYFNNKTKLTHLLLEKSFENKSQRLIIYAIKKHKNTYYFATDNGLLICTDFNKENNEFKNCKIFIGDKNNSNSITSNRVYDILIDDNLLWIGTNKLDLLSLEEPVFKPITIKTKPKINNNHIYSIYKTDNYLFIGTRNGLNCIDNFGNSYAITKENTNQKLAYNVIRSIAKIQNNLWLGTTKGISIINLNNFNPKQPKIKTIYRNPGDATSLNYNNIRNIYVDKQQQIWISTFGGGLDLFTGDVNKNKFTFKHFTHSNTKNSLSSDYVFNITQDSEGVYWVATKFGLNKMNFSPITQKAIFTIYNKEENKPNKLHSSNILTIFQDSDKQMWIGTQDGLYFFDTKNNFFTSFGKKEGLTNDVIYSILEDADKNLWLTTNSGIFKFDKKNIVFTNFSPDDGLQSSEFNLGAQFYDAKKNILYFGGTNGVDYFNPKDISKLYQEGNIKITSLTIKDKIIKPSTHSDIISQNSTKSKIINLKNNDFPLYLTFSDLNFKPYKNSSFYYKLIPNDQNWNNVKKGNEIQLLNLSPGTYKLQLQGKSHNKFWPKKPLEVTLNVYPPWYSSNLAFVLYFLLLLSGLLFIAKHYVNQKIKHQEMLRLKELDQLKTTLYTNITHEFRTPITVILGMTQNIKEKLHKKAINSDKELDLIDKNANNLLKLVNQILDLAKLEKGKLQLNLKQADIVNHIKYLTESFSSFAKEKDVYLTFYSEEDTIVMDYDADKITQIVSNLISNAIKFCIENDKIVVHLSSNDNTLFLKVQDSGIGIASENLPYIFNRFYQVENSNTKKYDGTGIGLALTKELILLMDGTIDVKSQLDKGTTFVISFPIRKNEELIAENEVIKAVINNKQFDFSEQKNKLNQTDLPIALVVEDNKDVAQYIFSCLKEQYQILYAENGEIGINIALEKIPDIIISDVMMPKKDGFELCETLKQELKTNHIPIILLTAKATQDDKITGLKIGADAYLIKPFSKEELLIRIKKLIEIRKTLQQKYSDVERLVVSQKKDKILLDKNDEFLNKIIKYIHDNIEKANLNATDLSAALHLSESQLYRKIRALTNCSISIFIRKVRLQKAKQLLEETDLHITEVAYQTGFKDPSWFSKCFNKEFGYRPSKI